MSTWMNRHVLVSKLRSQKVVKISKWSKMFYGCVLQQWMKPTIVFMTFGFSQKLQDFKEWCWLLQNRVKSTICINDERNIFFRLNLWDVSSAASIWCFLCSKITLYICASKAFQIAWHFWQNYSLLSRSFAFRSSKSCKWRENRWKGTKFSVKLRNKERIDLFMPDCEERIDH